jgi:hypothetical protein
MRFPPEKGPIEVIVSNDSAEFIEKQGIPQDILKTTDALLFVDLRGTGETTPGGRRARRGPFGADTKEAFLALHLDRPLLGQRVADLLGVLDAIASDGDVALRGIGECAPVALHAAALSPKVSSLILERPIVSWTAVASTPAAQGELANVVPGALEIYDLPDLAASLAPRRLWIPSAVDPMGKGVSQKALDDAYAVTVEAYRAKAASDKLVLFARP